MHKFIFVTWVYVTHAFGIWVLPETWISQTSHMEWFFLVFIGCFSQVLKKGCLGEYCNVVLLWNSKNVLWQCLFGNYYQNDTCQNNDNISFHPELSIFLKFFLIIIGANLCVFQMKERMKEKGITDVKFSWIKKDEKIFHEKQEDAQVVKMDP